jgi:hypothetical protein
MGDPTRQEEERKALYEIEGIDAAKRVYGD